jgi:hypothetical protein
LTLKRNSYFFYLWNIFEEKFLEKKNWIFSRTDKI